MMVDRSYPAQFPLRWLGKDVLLASGAAARQGLALRVAPAIGQLIEAALGSHADDDMSALVEAFRASAGQGSSRP
jgi:3-hydroxyisobutyrate dehydrogenase-like beta-hydroxyacid dehydrogenase